VKKRAAIIAGLLIVFLGAGALYSLPYVAIYRIIAAFDNQDLPKLATLVDFPEIRENLKRCIGVKIRGEGAAPPAGGLGKIPDSLVNRIVDRAVNDLITPEGLAAFMKEKLADLAAGGQEPGAAKLSARVLFLAFLHHAEMSYTSPAEFIVSFPAGDTGTLRFVLRRHGLAWRLTNLEF